jgi:hypothetical protein
VPSSNEPRANRASTDLVPDWGYQHANRSNMILQHDGHLSHYRLIEQIGEGGMGVVWKATDTRLDRTVAIKVLPPHLSQDPELRARFEREARTISQLNHPNICTLHDVGRHAEIDFIVMEHVEGEALVDRLKQGSIPLVKVPLWRVKPNIENHRPRRRRGCGAVENPPRVFQALWEGGPSEGLAFHRASDPQLGEEGVQGEERANPSTVSVPEAPDR